MSLSDNEERSEVGSSAVDAEDVTCEDDDAEKLLELAGELNTRHDSFIVRTHLQHGSVFAFFSQPKTDVTESTQSFGTVGCKGFHYYSVYMIIIVKIKTVGENRISL